MTLKKTLLSFRGSALGALNGVDKWVDKVMELMDTVDEWIQEPPRATDKPFLMPIEDVFSITGRGTCCYWSYRNWCNSRW